MNKELEHLKIIEDWANEHHDSKEVWEHSIPIQEALKRLKAIDNANLSEALELLRMIKFKSINAGYNYGFGCWNKIEQTLIKAQEQKKVLEILFKKQVDLGWLWYCIHECVNSLNEYNKKMPIEKFKLTEEEFDLLREAFKP